MNMLVMAINFCGQALHTGVQPFVCAVAAVVVNPILTEVALHPNPQWSVPVCTDPV